MSALSTLVATLSMLVGRHRAEYGIPYIALHAWTAWGTFFTICQEWTHAAPEWTRSLAPFIHQLAGDVDTMAGDALS